MALRNRELHARNDNDECVNVKLMLKFAIKYYLSTDAIIWECTDGDTFCQRCRGCGCDYRQSGAAGAAGADLVEGSAATSSLSFAGSASDSSNVLSLLQRDSSRYPELYSGMLQHHQMAGKLWH